ncbi:unnamed protein product, partial [Ectocarpus sp. 12 AP-2014]
MPHPPALRMCQSLPTALLSLAYLTASSTTAFVLGPLRASRVTSATNRRALLPAAAAYRRLTSASQHQQQQQRRCPTSTRLLARSTSSALTPTAPQAGLRKARSSRSGGVRSLKSVAAPAGLAKGVSAGGLGELLEARNGVSERFVFFGGKGGVGKTSTAAAVAIQCADAGLRTLVISTDPAHSLGDALDQDVSGGEPVRIIGLDNLSAMEVDTVEAVKEFEEALSSFDISGMAEEMGVPKDMVESLGLSEFSEVLASPPPGIDELVALSRVLKLARSEDSRCYKQVIQLRGRMGGILNLLTGMFGGGNNVVKKADMAVEKLQGYKERMMELRDLFKNQDATEFCIVTIPTQLAIAESKRLLEALNTQGVAVRNIVVNQIVSPDSGPEYVARLHKGQSACIDRLQKLADGAAGGAADGALDISPVPYFDMEVAGVYPLRFLGTAAYGGGNEGNWKQLSSDAEQRFIILGGK